MGTLRALTTGGGQKRRAEQSAQLRGLLEACVPGGFLLPPDFKGCEHAFVGLDSGYCVCRECGLEHFCCCGGCPEITTRMGERICQITGCVTLENELRSERDVNSRTGPMLLSSCGAEEEEAHSSSSKKKRPLLSSSSDWLGSRSDDNDNNKRHKPQSNDHQPQKRDERHHHPKQQHLRIRSCTAVIPSTSISEMLRRGGGENLRNLVEGTIREILASDKTERCREQERKRNEIKELSVFARGLREANNNTLLLAFS